TIFPLMRSLRNRTRCPSSLIKLTSGIEIFAVKGSAFSVEGAVASASRTTLSQQSPGGSSFDSDRAASLPGESIEAITFGIVEGADDGDRSQPAAKAKALITTHKLRVFRARCSDIFSPDILDPPSVSPHFVAADEPARSPSARPVVASLVSS